jgi:hypothetical protein
MRRYLFDGTRLKFLFGNHFLLRYFILLFVWKVIGSFTFTFLVSKLRFEYFLGHQLELAHFFFQMSLVVMVNNFLDAFWKLFFRFLNRFTNGIFGLRKSVWNHAELKIKLRQKLLIDHILGRSFKVFLFFVSFKRRILAKLEFRYAIDSTGLLYNL